MPAGELLVGTGDIIHQALPILLYPSGLQVSTRALSLLADALRAHRRALHSQWRALSAGRQALLVLARLPGVFTSVDLIMVPVRVGT